MQNLSNAQTLNLPLKTPEPNVG
jgi:hypothetical protein